MMLFLLKLTPRALRALALSRRTLVLENLALRQQLATFKQSRRHERCEKGLAWVGGAQPLR
jgi:hypothetical protein